MNTSSDFDTQAAARMASPLQAVWTTSLAQEAQDIVRHLGRVLDLQQNDRVLLVPGDAAVAALTLVNDYGCSVTVLAGAGSEARVQSADERISYQVGSLDSLPFEANAFDAVIVAVPITTRLQGIARELARVLTRSGRLGMVALSLYRDQLADEAGVVVRTQWSGQSRPAAAYRAVLGEAGFTAFLSEDRRRELRRSAQAIYRQHILEPSAPTTATLEVFAAGGVSMTLITAEKGL